MIALLVGTKGFFKNLLGYCRDSLEGMESPQPPLQAFPCHQTDVNSKKNPVFIVKLYVGFFTVYSSLEVQEACRRVSGSLYLPVSQSNPQVSKKTFCLHHRHNHGVSVSSPSLPHKHLQHLKLCLRSDPALRVCEPLRKQNICSLILS